MRNKSIFQIYVAGLGVEAQWNVNRVRFGETIQDLADAIHPVL